MNANHKISVLELGLSALCGVVLAFHRISAESGMQMFAVAAAASILLLVCSAAAERVRAKSCPPAKPTGRMGFVLLAASGFLFLLAAAFFFLKDESSIALHVITPLFAALSGAAMIFRVKLHDKGKAADACALVPVFFLSFYLLMFYRQNGDNPYLSEFGYEIALIIAVLLAVYAANAGRFEKPRPLFRTAACTIGNMLIVQEIISSVFHPELTMQVSGFSIAAAVVIIACGLLLCCGVLYPPVFVSETEIVSIEETEAADDAPSDEGSN